jgi:hypothetical protein
VRSLRRGITAAIVLEDVSEVVCVRDEGIEVGERVRCRKVSESCVRVRSGSLSSSVSGESESKSTYTDWSVGRGVSMCVGEAVVSIGVSGIVSSRGTVRAAMRCDVERRPLRVEVDGSIFKRTPRGGLQNDDADNPLSEE